MGAGRSQPARTKNIIYKIKLFDNWLFKKKNDNEIEKRKLS